MKKKHSKGFLVYTLFISFFIISIFVALYFVFYNINSSNLHVNSLRVISDLDAQIQDINDFRLDRIVFDVVYDVNKHQNKVLTEEYISSEDKEKLTSVGLHNIDLCYDGLKLQLPIVIYDDAFIKDNYIYFYQIEQERYITTATNIYFLPIPYKMGYYFYGWHTGALANEVYEDGETKIVRLSPMWSKERVYKIDFYHQGTIFKREYVLENEMILYPMVEEDDFYCWDHNELTTNQDLDITSVCIRENQIVVRFYTLDKILFDYKIVSPGERIEAIEAPTIEDYIFVSWNLDLNNINESMDCFPIYMEKDKKITINFYDTEGILLESKYICIGESVEFNYDNDLFYVSGYSSSLSNILSDKNITVYFKPYIYNYYVGDTLYQISLSLDDAPACPTIEKGYVCHWERKENSKTDFILVKEKIGEIFNLITLDDNESFQFTIDELIEKDVSIILSFRKNALLNYKWYFDEECSLEAPVPGTSVDQYNIWKDHEVVLFGKRIDFPQKGISGNFSNYLDGLKLLSLYRGENLNGFITNLWSYFFSDYKILAIEYSLLTNLEWVFIGEDILLIDSIDTTLESNIQYFIVDENNPTYYSLNGNLYDKLTNELLVEVNS